MLKPDEREFLHQTSLRIPTVNRALLLYVTLLAGFWGGHKFLLGARREGWLYLLLSWTSITLWMAMGDFFALSRLPVIGEGFMKRRVLKRHPADADVIEKATWWRFGRVVLIMAILVAGMAWMMNRLNEGGKRVADLCAQIRPGMPAQELEAFAGANGLRLSKAREGFNSLADTATLGRHSCHVKLEAGKVTESSHYFMD